MPLNGSFYSCTILILNDFYFNEVALARVFLGNHLMCDAELSAWEREKKGIYESDIVIRNYTISSLLQFRVKTAQHFLDNTL